MYQRNQTDGLFSAPQRHGDTLGANLRKGWKMKNLLVRLWKEESGQDLVEYALLVVLVALGAIAGMQTLASDINLVFGTAGTDLTSAAT